MDPRKFTEKSLLALEASQNEATRRQNTQIISIHLLQALVAQENGLIPRLLERMEIYLPTRDFFGRFDWWPAHLEQYLALGIQGMGSSSQKNAMRM